MLYPALHSHVHGNLGVRVVAVKSDIRKLEVIDVTHLRIDAATLMDGISLQAL
jgi:hypothetical protein